MTMLWRVTQIWPMVMEKAFAKLHGTYQAIGGGGQIAAALQALTGGSAWAVPTSSGAGKLWEGLLAAVEDPNVLVGAGTRSGTTAEARHGIVDGHAYSVLHAVEVPRSGRSPARGGGEEQARHKGGTAKAGGAGAAGAGAGAGACHRLLLLRNPWGHGEWTGPWSDLSREWDAHPECRAAVGDCRSTDDDGEFWMDIETFCALFASVDMCRLPGGHRHRTKNAEMHALAESEEAADGASPSAADPLSQTEDWLLGTCAAASSPTGMGGQKGSPHKAKAGKRKKK
jgi:hypothetical protein